MALATEITPQERLAISRKAIVRHMNRNHRDVENKVDDEFMEADEPYTTGHKTGTLRMVKHAARVWWQHHPASTAAELARPLLSDYASAHPFKLLGISATVGAAAVVLRPWRMVSLSTLVAAAVKSSGLAPTLASLFTSTASHRAEEIRTKI